jgi:protein-S-isoprenylcysteine O-methyltransferase Ste14
MNILWKWIVFLVVTLGIIWISRKSIRDPKSHGFYRFFAWEIILGLFLLNVGEWFSNPWSLRQLISWSLLLISLVVIISGVRMFNKHGKIDRNREDESLVGIEKTSQLVTTGIYHYIRHPFYSSLLFLGWGIFLKNISGLGLLLALINSIFLFITARREETENIEFFGESYQVFMQETKMFIPFLF